MADPSIWTDEQTGPASYATGGFTVSTTLASVQAFAVNVKTPGANLGRVDFDVALNSPGAGQVTVKVIRQVFDKVTAVGSITSLPSGVSSQASSGGTLATVSHTHTMTHTHGPTTSAGPAGGNNGSNVLAAQSAMTTHTHSSTSGSSSATNTGAEAAHTHTWNSIYQHQHALTNTQTDVAASEIPNGTVLSGATLDYLAVGT